MIYKKKILIVSFISDIFNPKKGDEIRINHIATEIARSNDVIILEPEKFLKNKTNCPFKTYGFKAYMPHLFADLNLSFILNIFKILKKDRIDIVQIAFPPGIVATRLISKLIKNKILIIYDAHNVEGDRIKHIKKSNLPFYRKYIGINFTPFIEKIAAKCADHIITVSSDDKNRFTQKYNLNKQKITVIPSGVNSIDISAFDNKKDIKNKFGIDSESMIVFHGTFSYLPNKEAIDFIRNYVAPKVSETKKNVLFVVAGLGVPICDTDNIKFIGFVKDIYPLLYAADIAIVPLIQGGGTRLKILDYMGVRLPIVSTKKGIEGINAENGKEAIIVDEVNQEFIDAIVHLINNKEVSKKIGINAYKLAEKEYQWDKICEKLDLLYTYLLTEQSNANK